MSRDVPDVVVFALVVVVTVSAVALPVSALGGPTATTMADTGADRVAQQTTANGTTNGTPNGTPNGTTNGTPNGTLAPGQRLAGVVGVQGAELDGELEERTLATRVSRAESNTSKAAVVATELNTARERLRTLRETQAELRAARQSGDMSTGEYRARMAVTAAQIRAVQTQLDSSEAVSRDLPDAALEARGVNRTELDRLRSEAADLRGPEVAEIARQIAGDDEGRELAPERGPGELPEPARDDDEDDSENGNAEEAGRPDDPSNGTNGATSGNQSTSSGPPEDAGRSEENGESGGNSGNSDGADSDDDSPGNSGEAGSSDDEDSPGNSGEAGNNSDGADETGNDNDSNNSGGKSDGTDGGTDGDEDSPGNSGSRGDGR